MITVETRVQSATRLIDSLRQGRSRRQRRRIVVMATMATLILVMFFLSLTIGQTSYSLSEVGAVILGHDISGATFTVGRLRLPRATLAIIAGLSFGLSGVTFQTMLRNPLASPDIIGISAGSSVAAAFGIIVFSLGGSSVSVLAIAAGLIVALLIYALAYRSGVLGTRLILIGIGVAAMLDSVTAYVLSLAGQWDLQEATRWLSGSLNGVSWQQALPALFALVILGPVLLSRGNNLDTMRLGDDTSAALGVRVEQTRIIVVVAAVGLIAFATAAAGPIAFVAFLSGPIAARIVGPHGSLLIPAALTGALLVLIADFVGQFALGTRFPVGVVTGALGAPYLVYLIIRTNRSGGSL